MLNITRIIEDGDVDYSFTSTFKDGKTVAEHVVKTFRAEYALALMILNDVVFLNDHWFRKEWSKEAQAITSINVLCNDVFCWASADAEELPYSQIETVYRMWRHSPVDGHEIWCMVRRGEMPQAPVAQGIAKRGVWDLGVLEKICRLPVEARNAKLKTIVENLRDGIPPLQLHVTMEDYLGG